MLDLRKGKNSNVGIGLRIEERALYDCIEAMALYSTEEVGDFPRKEQAEMLTIGDR